MKLNGYIISDTGDKVIIIEQNGLYKIKSTGVIFESNGEIIVSSFDDLVKLNQRNVPRKYIHKETEEELSLVEYDDNIQELYGKKDIQGQWLSLDDEFNYRKFVASYTLISKDIYEEEEIIVEVKGEVLLETNNPFITSKFSLTSEISDICVYDRRRAVLFIVNEKMAEIGAKRTEDASTNNKSLSYNIPSHSGIRFLKFAGNYLFNETYDINNNQNGKLETLIKKYESDREDIRGIIQRAYQVNFGRYSDDKTLVVVEAIKELEYSQRVLDRIEPKVKSVRDKSLLMEYINNVKKELIAILEVPENDNK